MYAIAASSGDMKGPTSYFLPLYLNFARHFTRVPDFVLISTLLNPMYSNAVLGLFVKLCTFKSCVVTLRLLLQLLSNL